MSSKYIDNLTKSLYAFEMLIKNIDELVDALGGTSRAAAAIKVEAATVAMWKSRRQIPARHYLIVCQQVQKIGMQIDPTVFGFEMG